MLGKMRNILRVDQILLFRVLVVVFLKMVDLVLVLVVAVVARSEAEVGELDAVRGADGVFGKGDGAAEVFVEEFEHPVYGCGLLVWRYVAGGFVAEAVGFFNVVGCPGS